MNIETLGKKLINKISWIYPTEYSKKTAANLAISLILISGFFWFVYYQKQEVAKYLAQAEEQRKDGHPEEALVSYQKAYKIPPLNRDVVHGYVGGLIYFERYDDAYKVITEYFNKTSKDLYIDDVDLWVDKAMAELQTGHCMDASVSAWHVLARTLEADKNNEITGAVMGKARECIKN